MHFKTEIVLKSVLANKNNKAGTGAQNAFDKLSDFIRYKRKKKKGGMAKKWTDSSLGRLV